MITAKQVYDMALVLIDEVTEAGAITPDTPKNYEAKARSILTTLQAEILPSSVSIPVIEDLTSSLLVSDKLALTALPYGLASHLMMQEGDMTIASYFNDRYEELKRKQATTIKKITDVYGVNFNG